MGIIYIAKNKINNKCYIGQTTRSLSKRKQEHETKALIYSAFEMAIQKYGKENFEWKVIDGADDQNILNMLERLYIFRYESSVCDWGYNIREGGSNGKLSKETRKRMSESQKKKEFTEEHRKNLSKSNARNMLGKTGNKNPFYGKQHPNKLMKQISKSYWGKYPGATFIKRANPEKRCWHAKIQIHKKKISLGFYEDPISASMVYKFVWREIYDNG